LLQRALSTVPPGYHRSIISFCHSHENFLFQAFVYELSIVVLVHLLADYSVVFFIGIVVEPAWFANRFAQGGAI
jgi:uncharacterized membrane protein